MKNRWIAIAIMATLAASGATAQMSPRHAGLPSYLQLTADQIATWQQIQKDTAAAVQPLAANARDLRKQLDTALQSATPDPTTIGNLALSLHSVRQQIRAAREVAQAKRLAVLTTEQRAKFDAFRTAMGFMGQHRRGPNGRALLPNQGR